jgi:hypothetical protein
MPADFSEYVNLTIFDKEPGDIYRDSIEIARLSLPEFNLRVGTPEDAIFQAMAYVSALNVASINRLPDRLMAGIVGMMGFSRQEAVPAEIDVVITVGDLAGGVIPEGTVFTYDAVFEDEAIQYAFTTTSATTVPPSESEYELPYATITVQAIEGGVIPPIGSGVELNIISSGTDIASAITATPSNFANGLNADTDQDYLSRASTYLRSLTSALAKASQVDAYVLTQYPGVIGRVKTFDLTNGDDNGGDITLNRVYPIENTYLQDNIATIELNAPHLYVSGDTVRIELSGASASASAIYEGEFEIDNTAETLIVFPRVASNQASAQLTGSVFAGEDIAGYVTIFAYGQNRFLTQIEKDDILADVINRSIAGLRFFILDPTLVTLEVSGTVSLNDDYDATTVQDAINNALIEYLSPATFPMSFDRVRQSQIVSIISNIPGVLYVNSLTLTPTGQNWLPKIDDDIIFKNKGTLPVLSVGDIGITYQIVAVE